MPPSNPSYGTKNHWHINFRYSTLSTMNSKPETSSIKSQKAIQKELEFLYMRKSAVVALIRSLEQHDRFQDRPDSKRKRLA